jgi:DNA-binding MarR family transcriptional regulator
MPDSSTLNSFGYFLEAIEGRTDSALQAARRDENADCSHPPCNDPQLVILTALVAHEKASCALDLMKETKLPLTILLENLRAMEEFGLVTISPPARTASEAPPVVELTPCGRKALAIYRD